ncbi:MAG: hypothetical protein OXN88_01800 [Chloroflexota bacterium]|nr:hypothetical protein [Chloroflexota bacterium]
MIETPARDVFAVITDFLVEDPSDDELLAYKLPDDLQERISYLLYLNRESELTCEQGHELDDFVYADNMISLLKTKIKLRQSGKSRREKAVIDRQVRNVEDSVVEFLTSDPTDDELLAYMFPEDIQARVHFLLDRNGEGELTILEERELDDCLRANRFMALLKVNTELRRQGIET